MRIKETISRLKESSSEKNLTSFKGLYPFKKGLKETIGHILVAFMSNLTPVLIVMSVFKDASLTAYAIQAAFLLSGIGTLLQLYPFFVFGAGLPVMMSTSFTFMGCLVLVGSAYGYGTMLASCFIGGLVIVLEGFLAKYARKLIKPIVYATVIFAVGLSLVSLGMKELFSLSEVQSLSQGGKYDFSKAWPFLLIAFVCLSFNLIFKKTAKEGYKELSSFLSLALGYGLAFLFNWIYPELEIIDFNALGQFSHVFYPARLTDFSAWVFDWKAIIFVSLLFFIASSETKGDTIAAAQATFGRNGEDRELRGALIVSGLMSSVSALFGSLPIDTSSENVAYVHESGVKNRNVMALAASFFILISFFPPVAYFFGALPNCVLAGLMLPIYWSVLSLGFRMLVKCGFNKKNTTIITVSIGLGFGLSFLGGNFFNSVSFPGGWDLLRMILANPEAAMFIIAFVLSWTLKEPKETEAVSFSEQEARVMLPKAGMDE